MSTKSKRHRPLAPPDAPVATDAPDAPDAPEAEGPTNAILESISDGVFTVDAQWRVTSFNRAAETITGIAQIGRASCRERV